MMQSLLKSSSGCTTITQDTARDEEKRKSEESKERRRKAYEGSDGFSSPEDLIGPSGSPGRSAILRISAFDLPSTISR